MEYIDPNMAKERFARFVGSSTQWHKWKTSWSSRARVEKSNSLDSLCQRPSYGYVQKPRTRNIFFLKAAGSASMCVMLTCVSSSLEKNGLRIADARL